MLYVFQFYVWQQPFLSLIKEIKSKKKQLDRIPLDLLFVQTFDRHLIVREPRHLLAPLVGRFPFDLVARQTIVRHFLVRHLGYKQKHVGKTI